MKNKRQLARERGKKFEREIGHEIADKWDKKYDKDVMRTPRSGAFSQFPGDLVIFFKTDLKKFVQECKHEKRLTIKEHIKECLSKYTKWILHFKYKGYGNYSLLPTDDLLDLFKTIDDQKCTISVIRKLIPKKKLERWKEIGRL